MTPSLCFTRRTASTDGIRKRLAVLALCCAAWSAGSSFALAQGLTSVGNDTRYLALGDSVAYGLNPFVYPPDLSKYIGYPQVVSTLLQTKVANASCPGETSDSFIDSKEPALPGFTCGPDPISTVFGPKGPVQAPTPLFVPYNGATSQLEYAVTYLKSHPNTKFVTINIGGNDLAPLLICTVDCEALAGQLLQHLAGNLATIYGALRANYRGPIITANYYPFDFNDPRQVGQLGAFTALNETIAAVAARFGSKIADVFTTFKIFSGPSGDPCSAGLLLKIPNGSGCDTHPTLLGQSLIGVTVANQLLRP